MSNALTSLRQRIEERSERLPWSGCWIWMGASNPKGYGYSSALGETMAHRLSYRCFKGDIGTMCVLHSCDIPYCVNPDHLFLGTQADNLRDMVRKERNFSFPALSTKCKNGHEFETSPWVGRKRICNICRNEASKQYKRRKNHGK